MALSSPLNLNTSSQNMTFGTTTYYGTKGLGKIETVTESPSEVKPLRFTLSGVPITNVALALTERPQGKLVTLKLAIFDPATSQLLDIDPIWAGRLNVFTLDDAMPDGTSVLSVTAEHAGIDLTRPGNLMYTDATQQTLFPGDLAFQFLNDQVEQRIVWPAASWGRK